MSYSDLLDELRSLSKLKNNWYSVAEFSEKAKSAGDSMIAPSRRIKLAAEASGFSPNTLNRMISTREFLKSVESHSPELLEGIDPNSLSFPNLELVKRLYQVNQDQGKKVLTEVIRGEITFRELREKYNQLVSENINGASSQQIARIEERDFASTALAAVKSVANDLFDGLSITIDVPRLIPLPIDAVGYETRPAGIAYPYAGFEFIPYRDQANWKQLLETLQYRTIFSSFFFKRFWVVFSTNTGQEQISAFSKILIELDCHSIGVAELPLDSCHLKIVHSPTGDPIQDWSGKIGNFRKLRTQLLYTK